MAAPTPTEVRQLVVETFQRLGTHIEAEAVSETILIRDGRYRGRSYRAAGMMAMWMIDIGLLQFYAADGAMLATISLFDRPISQRVAA
jgi:hypothetical protein